LKPKPANKEEIQSPVETENEKEKKIMEEFFNHCRERAKEENKKKTEAEKQAKIKLPKESKPPTAQ
jgi:hypothetical protein